MYIVRRGWVLLALAAAACGDDIALSRAHDLVIVAHQDDDLLFMQPDLSDTIQRGDPTTIVYVTAGDGGVGLDYAKSRIAAAKSAYGWVAGSQDWRCRWVSLAGHAAQRCDLLGADLALLFLGYPDGGPLGERSDSLLRLWEGTIDHANTIAERVASYNRAGLVAALGEVIDATRPAVIRTLEISAMHGPDHSDHQMVGALALLAAAHERTHAQIVSYRGYNVNYEPQNTPDAIYDRVSLGMRAYEACQIGCARCGNVCETVSDPRYLGFLHRHYAVATRRPPITGVLQTAGRCVIVAGDTVHLGDCAQATELRFSRGGAIHAGERCLRLTWFHGLVAAPCRNGPEEYFALDEEGHLWSGIAPDHALAMDNNHTMCLVAAPSGVRAEACGGTIDQRWVLARSVVTTPRAELAITAQGRSVELADLTGDGNADLCRVENGGLWCAVGDGAGGFGASVQIDAADRPLSAATQSLMLGDRSGGTGSVVWPGAAMTLWPADLDGDGAVDWCTATPTGPACGLDADRAVTSEATPWGFSFHGFEGTASIDGVVDQVHGALADISGDGRADLCVVVGSAVECAVSQGHSFGPRFPVLMLAPGTQIQALWLGDLDGDGKADPCVDDGTSIICTLSP